MSKRAAKFALMMVFFGFVLMFAAVPVHAQEEPGAAAMHAAEGSYFLTTDGARKLGGSIGAGLVIMGGAAGMARSARQRCRVDGPPARSGRPDQHGDDHHRRADRRRHAVRGRRHAARRSRKAGRNLTRPSLAIPHDGKRGRGMIGRAAR